MGVHPGFEGEGRGGGGGGEGTTPSCEFSYMRRDNTVIQLSQLIKQNICKIIL